MTVFQSLDEVAEQASTCVRCRLSETRTQVVFGMGNHKADLMVIGEAPGRNEDEQGKPFVGPSGFLLDRLIQEELGMDRSEFYIANAVKCRPPNNRDPKPDEVDLCRSWLHEQVRLVDPKVILTVGNFASRTILGTTLGVTKLREQIHEFDGRQLIVTFHPAAALRSRNTVLKQMRLDLVEVRKLIRKQRQLVQQ